MPIPRRISQGALQAIQPHQTGDRSGAYPIPRPEDDDEDEFSHVGVLPSLMPPANSPILRLVENSPPRLNYASVQMPAVRPMGYAGGSAFGDEVDEDAPLALDLQVAPSTHTSVVQRLPVAEPAPPPSSKQGSAPLSLGRMSGTYLAAAAPTDPRPGIVAFAGYGIPPQKLADMPKYAFGVMLRRITLRSDLKIARMRRLPPREIELYEAALRCADESAVTKGIALAVSGIVGVVVVIAAVAAIAL